MRLFLLTRSLSVDSHLRRSLDYMLGYLLFAGLFLLSFVGFVSRIQAALLFNVKFAKSLKRGRLLVRLDSNTSLSVKTIPDVAIHVVASSLTCCCIGRNVT